MGRPAKRMARVKTAAAEEERPSGSRAKKLKQSRPEQQEDDDRVDLLNQGKKKTRKNKQDFDLSLVGPPVPTAEAQKKWPNRYKYSIKKKGPEAKNSGVSNEEEEILQARCHYTQAIVDECRFNLDDDAYIKAEDGKLDYIARIIELFETMDGEPYFKAQWFYRAEDTVIKDRMNLIDNRRVFLSDITDDNPLNRIVSKVKIAQVASNLDLEARGKNIPPCDLYYDMKYTLPYLTFANILNESNAKESDTSSTISSESGSNSTTGDSDMRLLDLYSGCGAMSIGP